MASQRKLSSRMTALLTRMLLLLSIAFGALFIYVRYVSPTAAETMGLATWLILGVGILSALVGANLIYFSKRVGSRYPAVAHSLLVAYALVTFFFLMFLPLLQFYPFTTKRTIVYFLVSLGIGIMLNLMAWRFIRDKGQVDVD